VIQADSVGFRYADAAAPALAELDFRAAPGSLVCVAGAEGSGKTTLFRLLNGTAPRAFPGERSGSLAIDGVDPAELGHVALGAKVTSIFDDPDAQIISLTVEEEVGFALVQRGLDFSEIRTRVADALERVGLAGFERRQTGTLSGGQKQRLVTAAALALQPRLLLADEGSSALDPAGARQFFALVADLIRRVGTTAVLIERDLDLAFEYADEILVLDAGRIVLRGAPAAVAQEADRLRALGLRLPPWLDVCAELRRRGRLAGALPASEAAAVAALRGLAGQRESA
jgi:energy-coupling factor transport system ATP-binding protein